MPSLLVASRILTRDQAESRKAAAVRFSENVLDDPDRAADIEAEDLDDWIERKKITLIENPQKRSNRKMANGNGGTEQDLLDRIDALEQENSDLQDQIDAVADIINGDDGDDDDNGGDDDDDDNTVDDDA
jgi:hypothetical protein